ncbi:MAG: endolytic transglycosylase MltG [Actinobacteria bacterium]|nr:endolytic transglycosylase MltG [Actinomycetota bacterium]
MIKILKKMVLGFVTLVLLAALLGSMTIGYILYWPLSANKNAERISFKVKWGTSFSTATQRLAQQGIIRDADQFTLAAKILHKTHSLKAGIFELTPKASNYKILKDLTEGRQIYLKVTLPEGIDAEKLASILQKKLDADSARIIALVSDTSFVHQLGIQAASLEGYLYPETYNFTYGLHEKNILRTIVNQFKKQIPDSLQKQAKKLGYTFNQILTLASIVEGEAMLDSEMVYIASVYYNRLKRGMRLQADPTIQYIIPDGPRRLLNRDLQIDSPYNTYKYAGLPPGPINNPGKSAIMAALFPAKTHYLYFVADGTGGHIFSTSLAQHLRAKRKFDIIRRKVAKEKREARRRGKG